MRRTLLKSIAAAAVGVALSATAFAADPAKKSIVIGTTVGDFGDTIPSPRSTSSTSRRRSRCRPHRWAFIRASSSR